ncbi:antibiotic biosynthesis monooxygenase family protein [Actinomadura harenae]|uniref:Antibiotic biosynthesis monooxygenase n=1 Tax=Actinomadura harenae TaxID=2483351 RepID=A0A3M2M181_9ACTN|nr:antibiotic biosynthesis monooxygenase family protein [Actinomadura harenae]RMI43192.1 antibiotic biosynthesis monooxygenase [Actinomadura harenae]
MFTFINKFVVTGDQAEFEAVLDQIGRYMAKQPGYRAHRLYRSMQGRPVYVEMAEWDSPDAHRAAASGETFRESVTALMSLATAEPGGFELISD